MTDQPKRDHSLMPDDRRRGGHKRDIDSVLAARYTLTEKGWAAVTKTDESKDEAS